MLIQFYNYTHEVLGIHFWDIPAIVTLVVMVAIAIGHTICQKKRENDFEGKEEKKSYELYNRAYNGAR